MMQSFIFGQGQQAKTPQELERSRQAMAAQLAGNVPQNAAQGFAQLGQVLAYKAQQNSQFPKAPGSNPLMNLGRLFMGGGKTGGGLY